MESLGVVFTGGTIAGVPENDGVTGPDEDIWTEVSITALFENAGWDKGVTVKQPFVTFSENMQPEQWFVIASCVQDLLVEHDAVIVLHGTDTMTQSVTATSFLLSPPFASSPLSKPVVFTGANKPALSPDNDAVNNLAGAITAASNLPAGVYLSFCGESFGSSQVLCPGRTKKTLATQPFRSVATKPVATCDMFGGIEIADEWKKLLDAPPHHPFDAYFGDYPSQETKDLLRVTETQWNRDSVSSHQVQQVLFSSHPGANMGVFQETISSMSAANVVVHLETYTSGTVADETIDADKSVTKFARWCYENDIPVVVTFPEPYDYVEKVVVYDSNGSLSGYARIYPTMLTQTAMVKSYLIAHFLKELWGAANYIDVFMLLMGTPMGHEFTITT